MTARGGHPARLLRAAWLALLIGSVGLVAFAARAEAAGQIQLTDAYGTSVTFGLSEITTTPDVNESYEVRSPGGQVTTKAIEGYSLAAVLAFASARAEQEQRNFNDISYRYADVGRPSGGSLRLTREQVEADHPPVFFEEQDSVTFLRPSSGGGDANSGDLIRYAGGVATVKLLNSSEIEFQQAAASASKAKVGEKVTFTAVATSAKGEAISYRWSIDGKTKDGKTVKHAFSKPGRYEVIVTAYTASDPTGVQTAVTVQVGEKQESEKDRKGGGKEDEGADSGAADDGGTGTGGTGTGTGSGTGTGTGTGSTYSPGGTYSPPSSTPAPAPAPEPPDKPEKERPKPKPDDGLEPVEGQLLDPQDFQVVQPAAGSPGEVEQAQEGQPQADDGGGVPGAVFGLAGIAGLLALGGLTELRFSARL